MLYLTRVRFSQIGYRKAWFGNLTLDFSDQAGWPADTVVWLRNRGGKTSMLSLLFAVLAPAKPDFLGYHRKPGASKKALTDYVPAQTTSHVVLEFTRRQAGLGNADPADRLLVGMACEWRGRRRRPVGDDNFEQLFYTLRPRESGLTLDCLPFVVDRARLPLARYAEQLRAAHKDDPQLGVAIFRQGDSKAAWVDHLEGLGVDPEAVRLQIDMNRKESSAEEGLAFDSHAAFLDFILDLGFNTTDSEAVSQLLIEHAADLRAEPQDRLELDFLTEAVKRLDTLASAWEQVRTERTRFDVLVDATEAFAAELHAGAAAAEQAAIEATEERERAAKELTKITGQRRELARKAAAARRLAAELAHAEAGRRLETARQRREQAEADNEAWSVVPLLADQARRAAVLAALEEEASAREQQAAPLLARRRAAAVDLAGRLSALGNTDTTAAEAADKAAVACDEDALVAEADAKQAVAAATHAAAELEKINTDERRLEQHVARAVADGILPAGADLATVLTQTTSQLGQATSRADALAALITELEHTRPGLVARVTSAEEHHRKAEARATRLATRAQELAGEAAAITHDPRINEVADERIEHWQPGQAAAPDLDVWVAGPTIAARLDDAAAHADRSLADLAAAAAEDERTQAALVATQLLPCRRPVATALTALADAEVPVPAWSGWQYLADSVPTGKHADVIAAWPELVDGVVVLDAADAERARQVLAAAGLRPPAAVVVGPADLLLYADTSAPPTKPSGWFVVPPHPGLYDSDVAEAALAELDQRLERYQTRVAALAVSRDHDRKLADRIRRLLERCSPTEHVQLLADLSAAEDDLAAATAEHEEAGEALAAADRQAAAAQRERGQLHARIATLQRRSERLDDLIGELAEVQDQRARIPKLRADKADAEQLRTWAEEAAHEHRAKAREFRETAGARRAAARHRSEELDALHLDDDALATAADPGALALETLRERFAMLDQQWRAAVTDEELAGRIERAKLDLEAAQRTVNALRESVADRARGLLTSPDGADEDRRALAAANALADNNRAQAAFALAEEVFTHAAEDAAALAGEPDADVLDQRPDTATAAKRYAADLEEQRAAAQQAETAATNAADAAGAQATAAASRHQLLDTYAGALASKLDDAAALLGRPRHVAMPAAPYAGEPAAAKLANEQAIGRLGEQMGTLRALHGQATSLAEQLRAWAGSAAFEPLKATRARLQGHTVEELAAASAGLSDDYRSTASVLAFKLEQLGQHRRRIIDALADVTSDALRLLDRVEKASRLPSQGMGAWSAQPFVKLDFRRPASREGLTGQLSTLVDDLLHSSTSRGGTQADLPDGPTLVKRAVRVAVGNSFKAFLLEPDTFQAADRIPINRVGVLSGGQQLTVAIVLYCTLAEVRSTGRRRGATGGALLLDNPFGKVSDRSFFDLMHAVAGKLGIQLIYTGHDPNEASLETFRRVVRLRNDGMDPTGRRHVEVRDAWLQDSISAAWVTINPPTAGYSATRNGPAA